MIGVDELPPNKAVSRDARKEKAPNFIAREGVENARNMEALRLPQALRAIILTDTLRAK